ncbi:hypothetical protein RJ641_012613 [Dillenia turbinata]|uniref:TORTIFOLIA1/SINE1-2 N-terminal domain-containing protein n=1 Tax=Dillenia turbinata TaxID=194707 RepID=A0AAN8V2G7_9MAGN
MSVTHQKRSPQGTPPDLKNRVNTCLNKLSDRDTLTVASTELELIAKSLSNDSLSPFLNCISTTDSSEKSPVRKQCVRLLSTLSLSHGNSLSPHLSKMLSSVLRRLRDSDSSVRVACVEAVSTMASQITKPPFSAFLKPFSDAILLEQDYNAQIGASLCLSSAIRASPSPQPEQLTKLLPKLSKLLKSDSFKAKFALLTLIGSVIGVGGASNRNAVANLVQCLIEFLSNDDWTARKASAEAIEKIAITERVLASEFKQKILGSLESRRFDKVKVVRETMNHALEVWKEVPYASSNEILSQAQSKFSSNDNVSGGCFPSVSKSAGIGTPEAKRTVPTRRSSPSDNSLVTSARKRSPKMASDEKPVTRVSHKLDSRMSSNWKIEIAVGNSPSLKVGNEDDSEKKVVVLERGEDGGARNFRQEFKDTLLKRLRERDDKTNKYGGWRSGSRVVPDHENDVAELDAANDASEEIYENQKELEDLVLIRKQLLQIENQQSSLLELLQRFIGTSQMGMNSLETRVHGLEMALDEISYDLALSTGRISSTDSTGNTCCMLPGADFLSSKFWRRAAGRDSTSRSPSFRINQSSTAMSNSNVPVPGNNSSGEVPKLDVTRFQHQSGAGIVRNPLADNFNNARGNSKLAFDATPRKINKDVEGLLVHRTGLLNGAPTAGYTTPAVATAR